MKTKKPLTLAQKIFGSEFGNAPIMNERPAHLRSDDPIKDKQLFRKYKSMLREQTRVIKHVLR